jgi:multidrug efflux pump subunit AcrA (membrane-fusion protein)
MKKRIVIPAVLVAVAAIGIGSVLLVQGNSGATGGPGTAFGTASATVRDLTRTDTLNGVVAYQDMRDLSSAQSGIVTRLPAVGEDLAAGAVLMAINEQPVVLLDGAVPAYRDMKSGVPDGNDVQQLETSLLALGFGATGPGYPDAHWDARTTEAVNAFQAKVGATQDGVLSLGEIVFTAGKVHIAKLNAHVGGLTTPELTVMTVQSTDRIVMVDVDPLNRDLIIAGTPVRVELPSGDKVSGKIDSVSTTLEMNAENKSVYKVKITLDDPAKVAGLALAPVTVHYVTTVAKQVLSVPVAAVIGVPGGGYAVDAVNPDGTAKRTPVKLGAWGDGYVQVTNGDLPSGATVEVPK